MILETKQDYIDLINYELGKKKLFNQFERWKIINMMDDMDRAYSQHHVEALACHKKELCNYISDLVVRKITEQQMEEVEKLKEKGESNE